MAHGARHVDGWYDREARRYEAEPMWPGVVAWAVLCLAVALLWGIFT